ncbi:hypothetical protein GCM10011396_38580 [Undibacterium terreum]|uniref:Uncharacterized protein n=1 Tax=Undibacterium terreum TaxID=1224302 RepID=A0A916UUH0_9BURK|nr:hypothetical protein GCM10011396_38580 [Undibacterium terreum]
MKLDSICEDAVAKEIDRLARSIPCELMQLSSKRLAGLIESEKIDQVYKI